MANRLRPIMLTDADRRTLERLSRASSARAGLSRRARAVLLMASQLPGVRIAERTGYTAVQVSRLRQRFAEAGLAEMSPEKQPSRTVRSIASGRHALQPHRLTTFKFSTDPEAEAKILDVVGLYCSPPPMRWY